MSAVGAPGTTRLQITTEELDKRYTTSLLDATDACLSLGEVQSQISLLNSRLSTVSSETLQKDFADLEKRYVTFQEKIKIMENSAKSLSEATAYFKALDIKPSKIHTVQADTIAIFRTFLDANIPEMMRVIRTLHAPLFTGKPPPEKTEKPPEAKVNQTPECYSDLLFFI